MKEFVHLHNHSEHSLLDGMSRPSEMIEIAHAHGMSSMAITDHGTMSGTLKFQQAADKFGINAIHGVEAYYVPSLESDTDDKNKERFHLILLAKNDEGLRKLFALQQKAWTTGFYYKPRIEWKDLEFLSGDVVCLSGCMASHLCRLLQAEKEDEADIVVRDFSRLFERDYYIELQPWNVPGLNDKLISLADSHGILLAGTIDCHYMAHSDRGFEEALLMMGQMPSTKPVDMRYAKEQALTLDNNADLVDQINCLYPNRYLRFDEHANFIMNGDEVEKYFLDAGVTQDVYTATLEIADKCKSKIKTGQSLLPKFHKRLNSKDYLREIAELGLQELGIDDAEHKDRLDEELKIIDSLNFNDYFLIVWDICSYADRVGIQRGPGRGSVGGSLLAYCLGITSVDPLKYGLFFYRFINPERVSWPDIDMDFEDKRREEIKRYLKDKWGEENVASISTFGEFKAKSVVKSAATVFQIPFQEMNALTAKFETLEDLKHSKDGRQFMTDHPAIFPIAEKLENRVRTAGAHAAGVVVASKPLHKVCPIETRTEKEEGGRIKVTAYTMEEVEKVGLIKFDILGLKALAVVKDCVQAIKERHGVDVAKISTDVDDQDVINNFNTDSLVGIFQAEGAGYKNLIGLMGIDSFDDLVASNALVRPGAYDTQGTQYVECKRGQREVIYPHEILEPVLKETYGTFVYQEQLMQTVVTLAGFSWSDADVLRKIIGKKRDAAEFEPFHKKFVEGAQEYISEEAAEKMWSDFEKASTYMFNKSHSVAYSMLGYQTMWLKYYYPLEFIWASLANEDKNEDISTFLTESARLGLCVLPPDINRSMHSFSLDADSIRFGLRNVMGCGDSAIQELLERRPFRSYEELREKCKKSTVRTNVVENLAKVGALASIDYGLEWDHKKYYLPILSWAQWAEEDESFNQMLSKLEDVEDNNGIHVIRAVVKSVKRKPHYLRVEFEDSSMAKSFFALDKDAAIRSKEYLLALVGLKNLISHCDANDEDARLMHFLSDWDNDSFDILPNVNKWGEGRYQAIALYNREFKTKAGKPMSNAWLFEPISKTFQKVVLFPTKYDKLKKYFEPWNEIVVNPGNEPQIVDDVITADRYREIKGLAVASA